MYLELVSPTVDLVGKELRRGNNLNLTLVVLDNLLLTSYEGDQQRSSSGVYLGGGIPGRSVG